MKFFKKYRFFLKINKNFFSGKFMLTDFNCQFYFQSFLSKQKQDQKFKFPYVSKKKINPNFKKDEKYLDYKPKNFILKFESFLDIIEFLEIIKSLDYEKRKNFLKIFNQKQNIEYIKSINIKNKDSIVFNFLLYSLNLNLNQEIFYFFFRKYLNFPNMNSKKILRLFENWMSKEKFFPFVKKDISDFLKINSKNILKDILRKPDINMVFNGFIVYTNFRSFNNLNEMKNLLNIIVLKFEKLRFPKQLQVIENISRLGKYDDNFNVNILKLLNVVENNLRNNKIYFERSLQYFISLELILKNSTNFEKELKDILNQNFQKYNPGNFYIIFILNFFKKQKDFFLSLTEKEKNNLIKIEQLYKKNSIKTISKFQLNSSQKNVVESDNTFYNIKDTFNYLNLKYKEEVYHNGFYLDLEILNFKEIFKNNEKFMIKYEKYLGEKKINKFFIEIQGKYHFEQFLGKKTFKQEFKDFVTENDQSILIEITREELYKASKSKEKENYFIKILEKKINKKYFE